MFSRDGLIPTERVNAAQRMQNKEAILERIPAPPGLQEDTFEHAVDVYANTFLEDPFLRYMRLDDIKPGESQELTPENLHVQFSNVIGSMVQDDNATLLTVPGFDVTSTWSIETVHDDEPYEHLPRSLAELFNESKKALRSKLPVGQRYIHAILAGNRDKRKGIYSAMVRPMLQLADRYGLPIYGECTNLHSAQVHEHYGFQTLEVFHVGVGRVGTDGRAKVGGVGVPHWPVLYWPMPSPKI